MPTRLLIRLYLYRKCKYLSLGLAGCCVYIVYRIVHRRDCRWWFTNGNSVTPNSPLWPCFNHNKIIAHTHIGTNQIAEQVPQIEKRHGELIISPIEIIIKHPLHNCNKTNSNVCTLKHTNCAKHSFVCMFFFLLPATFAGQIPRQISSGKCPAEFV